MEEQKMKKQIVALLAGAMLMVATSAMAIPIRLDVFPDQPANSGDAVIKNWLVGLINGYNSSNNPDLSTISLDVTSYGRWNTNDAAQGSYPTFGSGTTSIALPSDLNVYLVLHWGGNSPGGGNSNNGGGNGNGGGSSPTFNTYQAYALDNSEISHTFVAPGQQGLSWYEFFGTHEQPPPPPVPEPGTMMLLGIGMLGMAVYGKRRMNKA